MQGFVSATTAGFTEDDQAQIAKNVVSRALAKGSKAGLGFSTDSIDREAAEAQKHETDTIEDCKVQKDECKKKRKHEERSKDNRGVKDRRSYSRDRSDSRERDRRRPNRSKDRHRDRGHDREARRRDRDRNRSMDRWQPSERRPRSPSPGSRPCRRRRSASRSRSRSVSKDRRRTRSSRSSERSPWRRPVKMEIKQEDKGGVAAGVEAHSVVQSIGEKIRERIASLGKTEPPEQVQVHAPQVMPGNYQQAQLVLAPELSHAVARIRERARQGLQVAAKGDKDLGRSSDAAQAWERIDSRGTAQFLKEEEARVNAPEEDLKAQEQRRNMIAAIASEEVTDLDEKLFMRAGGSQRPKAEDAALRRPKREDKERRQEERRARRAQRDDDPDLPLFKKLRVGDLVEAKFSQDGKWYKARIKSSVHGGYPIAMYGVHYLDYGNEEEISWRAMRFLEAAEDKSDSEPEAASPLASRSPSPNRANELQGREQDPISKATPLAADTLQLEPHEIVNPALLAKNNTGASWRDHALAIQRALQQKQPHALPTFFVPSIRTYISKLEKELEGAITSTYLKNVHRPKLNVTMNRKR